MDVNDLNGKPEEVICWFDDLGSGNETYRFLSNFYVGEPIVVPEWTLNGEPIEWATGEHAFAGMKFYRQATSAHLLKIVEASSPAEAKKLGRTRSVPLRLDWEVVKLDVMAAVIRAKFTADREEGDRLCATGDALLVEGTYWGDEVWGVALPDEDPDPSQASTSPGRNWLGTLLMARRAELRAEASTSAGSWNALFGLTG